MRCGTLFGQDIAADLDRCSHATFSNLGE